MSEPPTDDRRYRIRWARVMVMRPYGQSYRDRRCIAERRIKLFWLIPFWWPVGDWGLTEAAAVMDIKRDKALRSPLPKVQEF